MFQRDVNSDLVDTVKLPDCAENKALIKRGKQLQKLVGRNKHKVFQKDPETIGELSICNPPEEHLEGFLTKPTLEICSICNVATICEWPDFKIFQVP